MTTAHVQPPTMNRRALLFVAITSLPAFAESIITIFANESWYRERREPEQELSGTLRKSQPVQGPDTRSALIYSLETNTQSFAVYAAGVKEKLDRFTGTRVTVRGKLIDLRSEGFGVELWIATARTAK
jgi:hypothetical protein